MEPLTRRLAHLLLLCVIFGFLSYLTFTGVAAASGVAGPILWSDDETGMTSSTGFVFGSNCTSTRPVNPGEESAALSLMDDWATAAVADGFTFLLPATTPADGSSGDSATLTFPGSSVTATVSRRQVSPADAADLANGSTGMLSNNAVFSDNRRLQDCAPRPDNLGAPPAGMALAGSANLSGNAANPGTFWNATTFPAGNQLDAALFEFSEPVGAFGLWFGDLETRQPEPGNGAVLAVVKLLDSSGAVVASTEILPDEPVPDNTLCGGATAAADNLGCGNQSTRFIGFVEPAVNVAAMLVIVGDDDACDQLSNGRCQGISEYLSWIGPMLAQPQPDLTITKTIDTQPLTVGDPVVWSIEVSNIGPASASAGWSVADIVGAGATGLTLTGDPAEVDCSAVTSCVGQMALAPGDSVAIVATATHQAQPGVPVENVAHVLPAPGDRAELIVAGSAPAPGDDTSTTATNNDADTSHLIPVNPSVAVDKRVNGVDADTAPGLVVLPGTDLVYQIAVTNNGNVALADVELVDNLTSPGSPGVAVVPTLVGGDDNNDGVLDPGETWRYEWTVPAGSEPSANTATVTATVTGATGSDTVSAGDQAFTSPEVPTTTTAAPVDPSPTVPSPPASSTSSPPNSTDTSEMTSATTPPTTASTTTSTGAPVAAGASEQLPRTGTSSTYLMLVGVVVAGLGSIALAATSRLRRQDER